MIGYWLNIAPRLKEKGLEIPEIIDPKTGEKLDTEYLKRILPEELALQELSVGKYGMDTMIEIPKPVLELYETYRPTPLERAESLEKEFDIKGVRIFFKREDANEIGSYKLNSSYAQGYYASQEGVNELVADTGPGNWGLGMAVACRHFGIPLTVYMEERNYTRRKEKVGRMKDLGAKVIPVRTKEGTIAASLSIAVDHVMNHPRNRLSLGCLSAYSALHNTVIGLELKDQLDELGVRPDALIGVVGGGSSFSGLAFPFIDTDTELIAVESSSVPSFTKGEYRYENPDIFDLMPRVKMYTLGNIYVPSDMEASGLNYHGKNPLLSLLVHTGRVKPIAYGNEEIRNLQHYFQKAQGITASNESCYAIRGALDWAKAHNGENKNVIFLLTGSEVYPISK